MKISKFIATFLLSLSIALAGFPVQAQPQCPMAKMMQTQHAKSMNMQCMKDCKGCANTAKQEQKKGGCCDDLGCNAKCPAMSGGLAMNLPTVKADFAANYRQTIRLYPADATIASAHLNSQERPPKNLS